MLGFVRVEKYIKVFLELRKELAPSPDDHIIRASGISPGVGSFEIIDIGEEIGEFLRDCVVLVMGRGDGKMVKLWHEVTIKRRNVLAQQVGAFHSAQKAVKFAQCVRQRSPQHGVLRLIAILQQADERAEDRADAVERGVPVGVVLPDEGRSLRKAVGVLDDLVGVADGVRGVHEDRGGAGVVEVQEPLRLVRQVDGVHVERDALQAQREVGLLRERAVAQRAVRRGLREQHLGHAQRGRRRGRHCRRRGGETAAAGGARAAEGGEQRGGASHRHVREEGRLHLERFPRGDFWGEIGAWRRGCVKRTCVWVMPILFA